MAPVLDETITTAALRLHRMSYDVYEKIAELGLLGHKVRVELLDGLLINKRIKTPQYRTAILRGVEVLRTAIPVDWHVRPGHPVALRGGLQGDSAPEPDLMLVFGRIDRYAKRHPNGDEVGLVIEVADSPEVLSEERSTLARYAHADIPIACVINIRDRSIEVHREPSGPSASPEYGIAEVLRPGQSFSGSIGTATTGPAALAPIPIAAFFPKA